VSDCGEREIDGVGDSGREKERGRERNTERIEKTHRNYIS